MRESNLLTERPELDLRDRVALDVIASCVRGHVAIRASGPNVSRVSFQLWRPASRPNGKAFGEFFEATWHAERTSGYHETARVTQSAWGWTLDERRKAPLPSTTDAVREAFVRRALLLSHGDDRSAEESALRDRALRLVAGEDVSPFDPWLQSIDDAQMAPLVARWKSDAAQAAALFAARHASAA